MGSSAATDSDEPLTPAGRLFLQPQMNQVITASSASKTPSTSTPSNPRSNLSLMLTHPRFSSLMVRDSNGRERWHKTPHIDLDRHVIVLHDPVSAAAVDDEAAVNDWLGRLRHRLRPLH
ncbi:hypothetical protein M0R45_007743 [Rubus argutus]|uniref:Uncharacterized protein n=1 Tax=Rubus argutus TaxID=59490 RepID=A0AAW1XZH9_RUBAR